ncbi:BamA/TamA family outer membrane protein [Paraflavisolibacter sp. H34]|uniref:BamA/TamA family outer membrane protein n=1 Tax=Huijunlia imazamoxiresistens TaxID=3127457 RepID=UPI0030163DF2
MKSLILFRVPRWWRAMLAGIPLLFTLPLAAQESAGISPQENSRTVPAGNQYAASRFHQWLWGKHYRREWTRPVTLPLFYLDTAAGSLTPYGAGGGRQSKTLRLHAAQEREYVLRSIDKTYGKALPPLFQHTFIETLMNDQVSAAHPYAALTVPLMAEAAGIYHTWPRVVFLPRQPALDSFNHTHADDLYLFEQRPDENWQEAPNFGHSPKIISTEKLQERLFDSREDRVDQRAFVRARLFDMFLGDWGRHEDQWRWATLWEGGGTVYRPIPRDRDQTYTRFDGTLLQVGLSVAGLSHLKSFDSTVKDIRRFNFPARHLDRQMANEPSLQEWRDIAKSLQTALTDSVIEASVRQMPPEVFPISGPELIAKLKSRRAHLEQYARDYYQFLAREVEVTGSRQDDLFEVSRPGEGQLLVRAYRVKEGIQSDRPFYERLFRREETREVRLFGLSGSDVYKVEAGGREGITLRIIGGPARDTYRIQDSPEGKPPGVHVYDDFQNDLSGPARHHLSRDTAVHRYAYNGFHYDQKGLKPLLFYSMNDRFYTGLGYQVTRYRWRRGPYAHRHGVHAAFSLTQQALSLVYEGAVNQFARKWDLHLLAGYDALRWTNFYGLGNDSKNEGGPKSFSRLHTREVTAGFYLQHSLGKWGSLAVGPYYQGVKVLHSSGASLDHAFPAGEDPYRYRHFAGAALRLRYSCLDDQVVPRKGFLSAFSAIPSWNFSKGAGFIRYSGQVKGYMALDRRLVLVVEGGAATLQGPAEFYQLNTLGGPRTLRGYRLDRFRGRTSLYGSGEVRWLFDVNSYLFNGKAGVLGFMDGGRVWQPVERSGQWHRGVGGGILVAPFHLALFTLTYGVSPEGGLLQASIHHSLRFRPYEGGIRLF